MKRVLIAVVIPCIIVSQACTGDFSSGSRAEVQRDTVVIDGTTPACSVCSLVAGEGVTIGTPGDKEIPQRIPDVLRDSRGYVYLVFNGWSNKPVLRYDSAGRFLGTLGKYGNGPGEYTMTFNALIVPGDSIYVYDWNRRLQVFAPDGQFVRIITQMPGRFVGLLPDSGGSAKRIVVQPFRNRDLDSDTVRYLSILDESGAARDSFRTFYPSTFSEGQPVVSPRGEIWTFMNPNYRLERHARNGNTEKLIGVSVPDWSPPLLTRTQFDSVRQKALAARGSVTRATPAQAAAMSKRPRSKLDVMVDSTGLLWIARNVGAPGWDTINVSLEYLSPHEAPGEASIPREQEDRLYQTIIEVIDPERGELLARTSLPFLGHLAAPGYVGRVTMYESGHYRTMVYPVVLNLPARK
jgi:hypothetical protein